MIVLTMKEGLIFRGKSGLVLLDQVRTLDKIRLVKRIGTVEAATLQKVLTTLQSMFTPA